MRVNVLITPKKNEVIECTAVSVVGDSVVLENRTGRSTVIVAAFKKWIRFYVLPEEKPTKKGK